MKTLPLLGLMGLLSITLCKKNPSENLDSANQNFSDLIAQNDFDFQVTKNIIVDVLVGNPAFSNPCRTEIYDFAPAADGSLI